MQKQKGISTLLIILIVVGLVVVAAGGVFTYQYYNGKISNSQLPISNENSNAETAGWKTYTNSEYGFEFKYPQVETVTLVNHISPHGTDLILPDNNFIEKDGSIGSILTFSVFQKATGNLEEYISNDLTLSNATNAKYGLPQSSYQKISINGEVAYKIKYPGSNQQSNIIRVYIQNSKHTLFFQYKGDNTTVQQILSTFKFTP